MLRAHCVCLLDRGLRCLLLRLDEALRGRRDRRRLDSIHVGGNSDAARHRRQSEKQVGGPSSICRVALTFLGQLGFMNLVCVSVCCVCVCDVVVRDFVLWCLVLFCVFLLLAFWRLAFLFLQCVDFGFVFAFGSVRLSAPGFWFRDLCLFVFGVSCCACVCVLFCLWLFVCLCVLVCLFRFFCFAVFVLCFSVVFFSCLLVLFLSFCFVM